MEGVPCEDARYCVEVRNGCRKSTLCPIDLFVKTLKDGDAFAFYASFPPLLLLLKIFMMH